MIRRYSVAQAAQRTGLDEAEVRYYLTLFREFFTARPLGNCPIFLPDTDIQVLLNIQSLIKVRKLTIEEARINLQYSSSDSKRTSSSPRAHRAPVLGVAAGRRGVGKTVIARHLSFALTQKGKNVLLITNGEPALPHSSADFNPRMRTISLSSLSGSPGNSADVPLVSQIRLVEEEQSADYILVDCGAGRTEAALRIAPFVDEMLLVTGSDVGANADCFAAVRVLHELDRELPLALVINRVRSGEEARDCMIRLRAIARRMIGREITELGFVLDSETLASDPLTATAQLSVDTEGCFLDLAEQLIGQRARRLQGERRGLQAMFGMRQNRSYENKPELASC